MTSPLTATLARALYTEANGSGWDGETQEYRDSWYRYAERVLGTEHGQRIVRVVEAAGAVASTYKHDAGFLSLSEAPLRVIAALDALEEPSDDGGAAAA